MTNDDRKILRRAIHCYGRDAQLKVLLEEMAELQQVICKTWRGDIDHAHIAEEIADVEIMLEQTRMIFDIDSLVQEYQRAKLDRLERRLEGGE